MRIKSSVALALLAMVTAGVLSAQAVEPAKKPAAHLNTRQAHHQVKLKESTKEATGKTADSKTLETKTKTTSDAKTKH